MIIARVVRDAKHHFIVRFQEWAGTFMLAQFGFALLRPGFSFSLSPSYSVMASFATERTWATCLLTVAGLRFVALVLNGTFRAFRRLSPYVRSFAAFSTAFAWSAVTFGMLYGNAPVTGSGTYGTLAVCDFLFGMIVAGEAAIAERAYRGAAANKSS